VEVYIKKKKCASKTDKINSKEILESLKYLISDESPMTIMCGIKY